MKALQHYVTDLETSRKLQGAGIPQRSNFYWSDWHEGILEFGKPPELYRDAWIITDMPKWNDDTKVSCYLLQELLELLGDKFNVLEYCHEQNKWDAFGGKYWKDTWMHDKSPIQSVANLILKLAEEGIKFN